jgi:hypothetical protein
VKTMFECDMAGCFDTAELDAEFPNGESFEICESCAHYWMKQQENPKITRHKERKMYAMKTEAENFFLDTCDYCPSRYPAAVKFVRVYDQWNKSHWLEAINPLAGSDWLATWCQNCGPQHQSEINFRTWKEKKHTTNTERENAK